MNRSTPHQPRTAALLLVPALIAVMAQPSAAQEPAAPRGGTAMPDVIEAVRTPDERFAAVPEFPFGPRYATVPGTLRMHYVDEGDRDAPVVVLLHGLPSWSFIYRNVIPALTAAGFRVVAPDLIGFGRSDKPVQRADHTYARHVEWVRALLFDHLDLRDVSLFAQDWGGLIGLRLVAEHDDRFARVAIGNTALPSQESHITQAFLGWREMSQRMPVIRVGQLIQSATTTMLSDVVVAAYDAPFPDTTYQAAIRAMPLLVPTTANDAGAADNRRAWQRLEQWRRPFLTLFSDSDPITGGLDTEFRARVPGAAGQPHHTLSGGHFLQEDAAGELARRLVEFFGDARR